MRHDCERTRHYTALILGALLVLLLAPHAAQAGDCPAWWSAGRLFAQNAPAQEDDEYVRTLRGLSRFAADAKNTAIAKMLVRFNAGDMGAEACRQFFADLARTGTMQDVVRVQTLINDGSLKSSDPAGFRKHFFGAAFTEGGTAVEKALLTYRRTVTMDGIAHVAKKLRGRKAPYGVYLAEIGSWASQDAQGLRFAGDIDFSFVSHDTALTGEMKSAFDEYILKKTGLTPEAFDSICTAHGRGTPDVYIGDHGKMYGDAEMKSGAMREVDLGEGVVRGERISGGEVIVRMAIEDRCAKAAKGEVEATHVKEPLLSMEMVRHLQKDIVKPGVYDPVDAILKAGKYLERSNRAGDDVPGYAPADGRLAEFVRQVKAAEKARDWGKMAKLLKGELGGAFTLVVAPGARPRASIEANARAVQEFFDRCAGAIWKNVEEGLRFRLEDVKAKMGAVEGRPPGDPEVKKLLADLTSLHDNLEAELLVLKQSGVAVPSGVAALIAKLQGELAAGRGKLGAGAGDDVMKQKKFIEELIRSGKKPLHRVAMAYLVDIASKSLDKTNSVLDVLDNVLLGELRGESPDFDTFLDEARGVREAQKSGKPGALDTVSALKTRAVAIILQTNTKMNEMIQSTAAGRGGMKAMMAVNLFQEAGAYYDSWDREGYEGLATEFFRRRVPGGAAADAYFQENYLRVGVELVYTIFPPLAIPEGIVGMVSAGAEWSVGKMDGWKYRDAVERLYDGARFAQDGEKRWRLTGIVFKDPAKGTIELFGEDITTLTDRSPEAWRLFVPQVKRHPVIAVYEEMLDTKALSDGRDPSSLALWPLQYRNLNGKYGRKLYDDYRRKVDEVTREYFKGLVAELELRKNYEAGIAHGDITALEEELGFRPGALVEKIEEKGSGAGAAYGQYLTAYSRIAAVLERIWELWSDFRIDSRKGMAPPLKLLMGGREAFAPCLTGEPERDLAEAERCLKAHWAAAKKARADLAEALGREPDTSADARHLGALGQLAFEIQHLKDDSPEAHQQAILDRMRAYRAYLETLKEQRDLAVELAIRNIAGGDPSVTVAAPGEKVTLEAVVSRRGRSAAAPKLIWTDDSGKVRIGSGSTLRLTAREKGESRIRVAALVERDGKDEVAAEARHTVRVKAGESAPGNAPEPPPKKKSLPIRLGATAPGLWTSQPAGRGFKLKRKDMRWERPGWGSVEVSARVRAEVVSDEPTPLDEIERMLQESYRNRDGSWVQPKLQVRAFSLGAFKGFIAETQGLQKYGWGYGPARPDGAALCPRSQAEGQAVLTDGSHTIDVSFSLTGVCMQCTGPGMEFSDGAKEIYRSYLPYLSAQSDAAYNEAKAIIASLTAGPDAAVVQAPTGGQGAPATPKLTATVTRVSGKGSRVAVGERVELAARIAGAPEGSRLVYRWEPHPAVLFEPSESEGTSAVAVFPRPGAVKVWVEVYEKKGGALTPLGESEQVAVDVAAPKLSLAFTPAEPRVGQQVTARVTAEPDSDGVDFRWEYPAHVKLLESSPDGRAISFVVTDGSPAELCARGRTPFYGDSLGEARGTVTARAYDVHIDEPTVLGGEKSLAEGKDIRVKASVSPAPERLPLRYRWSVTPGGCAVTTSASRAPRITLGPPGAYAAAVTVSDAWGIVLGSASTEFAVAAEPGSVAKKEPPVKSAALRHLEKGAALRKAGKHAQAAEAFTKAIEADPSSAAAYNGRGLAREGAGDGKGAMDDYTMAVKADPHYVPAYLNAADLLYREGVLDQAREIYDLAIAVAGRPEAAPSMPDRDAVLSSAYCNRGVCRAAQKDYRGALGDFEEALRLNPKSDAARRNLEAVKKRLGGT